MPSCHVCKGESFTIDAGFSFCDDCGTQAQHLQELEYDTYFDKLANRLTKTAFKAASERHDVQLTTWEEFNYIIVGLVNELISLGAKPELKLTALQLWSAYLRENEAAFFSRTSIKIPKLSASFKKRDAEIIYNLKKIKRKRVTKASSLRTSNSGLSSQSCASSKRRHYLKTQRRLMTAEYDTYQTELETNTSMSVLHRSSEGSSNTRATSRTSNASSAITIEFSRLSRRLLKKSMAKRHLRKHEQDGQLECHEFKRKSYARSYHPEILARNTIFEVLYLALNQCGDDLQLGDMLRYIREGHLTFNNILKFFPPDLGVRQKFQLYNQFNLSATSCPAYAHLRFGARQMVRLLGVRMRPPNMVALTKRYCAELALPGTVHKLIETLLTICPPRMRLLARGRQQLPLYEGRAVAYIMFALKLLFGLDDEREVRMSTAAQRINGRLRKLPGEQRRRPLFVWTEWMRYMEMRNVILAQCHYATAQACQPNATAENAPLYADFLRSYHEQADLEKRDAPGLGRRNERECMANMNVIFASARQRHELAATQAEGVPVRSALRFEPTLMPRSTYLERLLEDTVMASGVHIPAFMYTDHCARDVLPFLRPNELRRTLAGVQRVHVVRLSGVHRFRVEPPFKSMWPATKTPFTNHMTLLNFNYDIDDEDWQANYRKNDRQQLRKDVQSRRQLAQAVHCNLDKIKSELIKHRTARRLERNSAPETAGETAAPAADDAADAQANGSDNELFSQLESEEIAAAQAPRPDTEDPNESAQPATTTPTGEQSSLPNEATARVPLSARRDADSDAVPLFEMVLSDDDDDDDAKSDCSDDDERPLEFCVNSFDYWMCSGRLDEMQQSVFKDLCQRMPRNFVWLLRQCAQMIECNERDVYRELLVVENFYAYRLAPVQRMRNMLLYQPVRRRMHVPELSRLVLHLSTLW